MIIAGGIDRINLGAGATSREASLEVSIEALNTASQEATILIVYDRTYSWLFSREGKEHSMRAVLERGGFSFDTTDLEDGNDPLARTSAEYKALFDTSFRPEEVSAMLGVNVSEVLRRLEGRTLYGKFTDDGWRIFEFQFEEGRLLPGLEEVLPLLHEELHPVAVYRWFVSPSIDLTIGDEQVSPRQWLLSGRNIAAVARIALDL